MENVVHVILKSDVVNVIHHQMHVQNVIMIIIYHQEVVHLVHLNMVIVAKHVHQQHVQHVYQIHMPYQELNVNHVQH